MTEAESCLAGTGAFEVEGALVWRADCSCGWVGPEREDEFEADLDRLGHVDGYDYRA